MTDPAASIVIPVLRQSDAWLERSVRSGLDQTAPSEVVVVTAPATPPRTRAVLARLAAEVGPRLVVLEAPPGFARALNRGFRAARATRLGLLLSDDWLEPGAVEACLGRDADIVTTWKRSYAADDIVTAMAHATRYGVFDAQALGRILETTASPRSLDDQFADRVRQRIRETMADASSSATRWPGPPWPLATKM